MNTKRFEFMQKFEEYTDYDCTRSDDPIIRVTLVNRIGQKPYAYTINRDYEETKITYEEGLLLVK